MSGAQVCSPPQRSLSATWLRKQRTPEDLIRFWLGHAKSPVTDGYSKMVDDLEYRLEVAENIGAGFAIPTTMIPMVPGIRRIEVAVVAA